MSPNIVEDTHMNHTKIVDKLIGPVEPVGESYEDNLRGCNLDDLILLTDNLLTQILRVSWREGNQASVKKSADKAKMFLKEWKDELEDL